MKACKTCYAVKLDSPDLGDMSQPGCYARPGLLQRVCAAEG